MLTLCPPGPLEQNVSMRRSFASICDVDFVGFGQHGDGRGRGVDASARLGGGHALHAVHAALVFQLAVDALAFDVDDDFLDAALPGFAERHDLELPALPLGEARVHPIEIAGEERRLFAARAAADFDDDVLLVVGILGQEQHLELADQPIAARVEPGAAPLRRARACRHRCPAASSSACAISLGEGLVLAEFLDQRLEIGERLRLLAVLSRIVLHRRRAERGHQFLVPRLRARQACRTCLTISIAANDCHRGRRIHRCTEHVDGLGTWRGRTADACSIEPSPASRSGHPGIVASPETGGRNATSSPSLTAVVMRA